jgi:hypothetical protein
VKLRVRRVFWVAFCGLVAASCGNDQQHPPFVSGTCTVPPCSTPTSRGSGVVDAGHPADAADAAADAEQRG